MTVNVVGIADTWIEFGRRPPMTALGPPEIYRVALVISKGRDRPAPRAMGILYKILNTT